MKKFLLLLFCLFCLYLNAQVKIGSWNLCDMGKSKSPESIKQMADILKEFDIVALQEIVVGPEGALAVAHLTDELNKTGAKWSYAVSNPTVGDRQKRERYAFIWKPSTVTQIGKTWLDNHYSQEVEREPYFCTFCYNQKEFTIVNYHAITKRMQPETEIKYFKFYPEKYPNLNLVFTGDFNCPQSHTVFEPLKRVGYTSALTKTKTTLKRKCTDDCTASEFDNFFYNTKFATATNGGAIEFYKTSATLDSARELSDHLPIWMVLTLK
jgi:deoxyribonuclease-1-like protein